MTTFLALKECIKKIESSSASELCHVRFVLCFFLCYSCRGSIMAEIVNKFEYSTNLMLNDKSLRASTDSGLHLCSNACRCLTYVP